MFIHDLSYNHIYNTALNLPLDVKQIIYKSGDCTIYILRPSKLTRRFANYDVLTNFQIWIKEGPKEYKPNHLRVLIDLKMRVTEHPDSRDLLLEAFDNIHNKINPLDAISILNKINFTFCLHTLDIIAVLAQLFIIEQLIGFNQESKYEPKSLYLQGWIRQFISSNKEIDNLVKGIASRHPPQEKYTCQDNKLHKKYNPFAKPLWYILSR